MSPLHVSFPGSKSRRDRQAQRSTMDRMVANHPSMQGESARGRQPTRRGDSPVPPSYPSLPSYGISGYGPTGYTGSPRQHPESSRLASPTRRGREQQFSGARDPRYQEQRPRGGRDGTALDGLGYRTYSPQPATMRRRFKSPDHCATTDQSTSSKTPIWQRGRSPPPKRYAPRSTTSGNLSFNSKDRSPSRRSTMSALDIGPPARTSSSTDFSVPSAKSYHSSTHGNKIFATRSFGQSTVRDSSASRNALCRVQKPEYEPARESPREAIARAQMKKARESGNAREPERNIPRQSERGRNAEPSYLNADGFPSWYERHLRHARPSQAQRDHDGRTQRVEQQGFRNWYWGKKD